MKEYLSTATPLDHARLCAVLTRLADAYPAMELSYLGKSMLGRAIPLLKIGQGRRAALYVGTHHGMEWITSALLLRFWEDFCDAHAHKRRVGGVCPSDLCRTCTLYVIPMLNPDGAQYQIHGVTEDNPLYERLIEMNGGSTDFSHWQANARGVDLNHNYDAGFAEYKELEAQNGITGGAPTRYSGLSPESEPEVSLLCNFIRFHRTHLRGVMTLHTQGEEIFFRSGGVTLPNSMQIAQKLSALTGYRPSDAEGLASYGGLTDWCVQELELPAFTLECGRGENPLPFSDLSAIYVNLRNALFRFPMLL